MPVSRLISLYLAPGHEAARTHTYREDQEPCLDLVGIFPACVHRKTGPTDKMETGVLVLRGFTHHCTLEKGVSS